MARKRRTFTDEFKAEAVALVLDRGLTMNQGAEDLDLTRSSLRNWVRQAEIDRGQGGPEDLSTSEKEELQRLRKENRVLREEREILKKAAAFFAKENR